MKNILSLIVVLISGIHGVAYADSDNTLIEKVDTHQTSSGWISTPDANILPVRVERVDSESSQAEVTPIDTNTGFPIGISIVVGIDLSTSQILAGSVGLIIGKRSEGQPVYGFFSVEEGVAMYFSAGIAGYEASLGYYTTFKTGGSASPGGGDMWNWGNLPVQAFFGIAAYQARLENAPFFGREGGRYFGPEASFRFLFLKACVGMLFKAPGQDVGGSDFIMKYSVGLELPAEALVGAIFR